MKNTGELIAPALEPYRFFNPLAAIDKNVAEKNRALVAENLNLRSEIERGELIERCTGSNRRAKIIHAIYPFAVLPPALWRKNLPVRENFLP